MDHKKTVEDLNKWLEKTEDLNLEFKAAKNQFDTNKLLNYCAAIANEGGGKLILGIENQRIIIGTKAYSGNHSKLPRKILNELGIRIDVQELMYGSKRVLIFHIPSRPIGKPIKSNGRYLMRAGESLTEMDEATLKEIFNEDLPDFSSLEVPGITIDDLGKEAIQRLKQLLSKKSQRQDFLRKTDEQTLRDLSLMSNNGLNYTSLILLGKQESIEKFLPNSELIFEWRQEARKTAHDYRENFRGALLLKVDEIWKRLSARNLRMPFQEGFVQREIWAFEEKSIREAVLNAVTHRDYSEKSRSIIIKASPDEFMIESPGGFMPSVTPQNILDTTSWRNRRLAETLEKVGLVERAGQGMNDIFEQAIRDGKGLPDLTASNDYAVILKLPAKVQDAEFILFLEKIANEKQISFSFNEIYELEQIRKDLKRKDIQFKTKFLGLGIIERIGQGRGSAYILAHKYYAYSQKTGAYTRITGVSREQAKQLILNHVNKNKRGYRKDFRDIFPDLKPMDISNLLRELKVDGKIEYKGKTKPGYWITKKNGL